jgi:hypothetical protein
MARRQNRSKPLRLKGFEPGALEGSQTTEKRGFGGKLLADEGRSMGREEGVPIWFFARFGLELANVPRGTLDALWRPLFQLSKSSWGTAALGERRRESSRRPDVPRGTDKRGAGDQSGENLAV